MRLRPVIPGVSYAAEKQVEIVVQSRPRTRPSRDASSALETRPPPPVANVVSPPLIPEWDEIDTTASPFPDVRRARESSPCRIAAFVARESASTLMFSLL